MSFDKLTVNERNHIRRAHQQALRYASRGFFEDCQTHIPDLPPHVRSILTGLVGRFLDNHVVSELVYLMDGGESTEGDGLTRIAKPDF